MPTRNAALLVVVAACSSSSTPSMTASPTTPATFTNVYQTVIARRCAPCHTTTSGAGTQQGRLDMTTQATAFANLVGAPASGVACNGKGTRVTPGKPDDSIMYLKVSLDDPSPCGAKMPLDAAPLTQDEADLVEAWINAGAKDD